MAMMIFHPYAVPYEDKIIDAEIVYDRQVKDNTDENEHSAGDFGLINTKLTNPRSRSLLIQDILL